MKLSKKEEQEVLNVYDTWLNSYLNGDVVTYDPYLDEEYHFIGSTDKEDFLNRVDTTAFFRQTADQLTGKTRIRNKRQNLEKFGEIIFITELFDADFIHGEDWGYYGKFRFTSALQHKNGEWKFIYQHFSMPDSRAQKGETMGMENVAAENLMLREAVQRRTKELEEKNRELEIEASLEKVRTASMAMQNSNELTEVSTLLFKELFGFCEEIQSSGIVLCDREEPEQWMCSYDLKMLPPIHIPKDLDKPIKNLHKAWESQQEFFVETLSKKEAIKHSAKMMSLPEIKAIFEHLPPSEIKELEAQTNYAASFKQGYLLAITDFPVDSLSILPRFAKAFEQTYTRFLDLQKAEAQAREAQIQAALERVRAASMAMHKSDELSQVASVLFSQIADLKLPGSGCGVILLDDSPIGKMYYSVGGETIPEMFPLPVHQDKELKVMYDAWKNGEKYYVHHVFDEAMIKHEKNLEEMFKSSGNERFLNISKEYKEKGLSHNELFAHHAYFDNGCIILMNDFEIEDKYILIRFAKVFEQTYTRFLDLQKVEAQAREAQIETIIERVRSRTMAMQKSEELMEVVNSVFGGLQQLNYSPHDCTLLTINEELEEIECWSTVPTEDGFSAFTYKMNAPEEPFMKKILQAYREQKSSWVYHLKGADKKSFDDAFFEAVNIPEMEEALRSIDALYANFVFMPKSGIAVFRDEPMKEEGMVLLQRFSKVVNLCYTRFLDLQKAEAQAREAQIEAALERVRAASMAMHHSLELSNIIYKLYQELYKLDIELDRCMLTEIDPKSHNINWWFAGREGLLSNNGFLVLNNDFPSHKAFIKGWKKGTHKWEYKFGGEEKKLWDEYAFIQTDWSKLPPFVKDDMRKVEKINLSISSASFGNLIVGTINPLSDDQQNLIHRFAVVFDQSYTRFLDLQKAEAQAREAQIEVALERVRAKGLAMHQSQELSNVVSVIFNQLSDLNIDAIQAYINIIYLDKGYMDTWLSQIGEHLEPIYLKVPTEAFIETTVKSWMEGKSMSFLSVTKEDEIDAFVQNMDAITQSNYFSERHKEITLKRIELIEANHKYGKVGFTKDVNATVEDKQILIRFAKVFEQTYTRFLDLQKAEAQAREAQIEAALERVRAASMAMHNSSNLFETAAVMFKEIKQLGANLFSCGFSLCNESTTMVDQWMFALPVDEFKIHKLDHEKEHFHSKIYNTWKSQKPFFEGWVKGKDMKNMVKYLMTDPNIRKNIEHLKEAGIEFPKEQKLHAATFSKGYLLFITTEDFEETGIFVRFAKVFEQTYTRFLDLQRAEEQTREAQIESSLERVRASAMAMHNSEELPKVSHVLYNELEFLGLTQSATCGFVIVDEKEQVQHAYGSRAGKNFLQYFKLPLLGDSVFKERYDAWKIKKPVFHQKIGGSKLRKHLDIAMPVETLTAEVSISQQSMPDPTYFYIGSFSQGYLQILASDALTDEQVELIPRFAKVFEQSYTRFLDLQKAEAQAREAQIQLALERVRARTIAMQNSDELTEVSYLLNKQVVELGIPTRGCAFNIYNDHDSTEWFSNLEGTLPVYKTPRENIFLKYYEAGQRGEELWIEKFSGERIKEHYKYLSTLVVADNSDETLDVFEHMPEHQIDHVAYFKYGYLLFITLEPAPDAHDVFKRFAHEFEQTYTRFLDLKRAEEQAKESKKQASLDRVRGEIASMRHTEDLSRITPVIWRELISLEVPFTRCGVFIVDEEVQEVEAYLSTPDGKALGVLHLPFDINTQTTNTVKFWRKNKVYTEHWDAQTFAEWTKSMVEMGQVKDEASYQGHTKIHDELHLHFVPFQQGMLYVGDENPLPDDKIELVKTLAESFSIAYARYEDFKNLEKAKSKIEITLDELKATQSQLIQSEKMASLGELTAGIAHEIQNPLNFVNNFSEVSTELIDEAREEMEAGETEEVHAILDDLKGNLVKISHHGKRASGIVRSMLDHSRTSSDEKVETDINALCDEYLRLAYHGMRARDRSFNADFEINLDPNLPKIKVIPQDIGRVLLNLINNAFQATQQMTSLEAMSSMKPKVIVTTKATSFQEGAQSSSPSRGGQEGVPASSPLQGGSEGVLITISDNGPGIPDDIKDKIFQPFFTTKPTGQGTGLGLSLAYDIVKAHGGEIVLDSKEGVGTTFKIVLQTPAK